MRWLATATGARPPVRRRPLNLSEGHFSSITRNPIQPQVVGGSTWSVKIHDFGKQWIESSWGKVEAPSGQTRVQREVSLTKNRTKCEREPARPVRSEESALRSARTTWSR